MIQKGTNVILSSNPMDVSFDLDLHDNAIFFIREENFGCFFCLIFDDNFRRKVVDPLKKLRETDY